ncbi:Pc12g10430 [Penicillium rubens Wisconsin 54-1255]|uniref:Pc12g10430 protein n=1 Tax=Penicillium rubens (strain ATCC 28089 / DSM 1075 / NRRL 1951 / Wisconsin 54-1255) TaxID=500485 RepID=B6H0I1_PENRW|nr:Pc12g10430 [Penicillium rubens Wisconsin 54-1255]
MSNIRVCLLLYISHSALACTSPPRSTARATTLEDFPADIICTPGCFQSPWHRSRCRLQVEGEAQGTDEKVQKFLQRIDKGPPRAHVVKLEKRHLDTFLLLTVNTSHGARRLSIMRELWFLEYKFPAISNSWGSIAWLVYHGLTDTNNTQSIEIRLKREVTEGDERWRYETSMDSDSGSRVDVRRRKMAKSSVFNLYLHLYTTCRNGRRFTPFLDYQPVINSVTGEIEETGIFKIPRPQNDLKFTPGFDTEYFSGLNANGLDNGKADIFASCSSVAIAI